MGVRKLVGKTSYEQVEEAALEIVAAGRRPTLRAVREALGGGSLAAIGRHLTTWDAQRTRSQASSPFAVSAQDVEALAPADFVALINHLMLLEVRKQGLPTAPDTTSRINDADGGVDGMVEWSGGPERTPRLPARMVVWQAKSGRRLSPSDLVREIMHRDGSALKSRIHAVLAAGGAYVVYSAVDLTADQKMARVSAMLAAARPNLPGIEPKIYIASADEIAAWAATDLWSRTFLIRAAGRDHTALLSTFEEWSRQPELDNPYVWNETTKAIAGKIREAAKGPGSVFRLIGASGLGKTRLVLEALRPLVGDGVGAVYFDARYPGTGLQLLNAIPDWRRLGVGGTLIVDDCDLDLHQQIAKAIAGTSLSAITINHQSESLADATLRQTNSETIEQIVKGFDPQPVPPNFMRIVEYAEGWPLMAVLLLRAVRNESPLIADLNDDQLTQRLIGYSETSDAYNVLALLALFDHVGYRERVASEWEHLRATFLSSVSHENFHRIVKGFERRGLVVAIGRYWRVTPPPLAIRLTRRWLEDAPPERRTLLFASLPDDLAKSLARRFGDVTTDTSVALAAELLAPSGLFGATGSILDNLQIVRALAEVNPQAAVRALTRTLSNLTDKQLAQIDEKHERQVLVWTLEAIAFHAAHFKGAALLLFDLARNENATNSNNATGTLAKFFAIQGSQTEADPKARISVIDMMLESRNLESSKIVAKALSRVLSINQSYVMLGVESQGGRPPLVEWRPTIYKDIFDYISDAIQRLRVLSTHGPEAFDLARDVAADGIPLLIRYRRWDDLEAVVEGFSGRAWPKAVDRLRWAIRHDLQKSDDVELARANRILESLIPTDFIERVELFVSQPPHDLYQAKNGTVDRSLENVERFAQETIEAGNVRAVFDVISSGWQHRLPHGYGQAVAKRTTNREQLVVDVLAAYASAEEPRNDLAVMSVVGTIGESDPKYRRLVLLRILEDDRLVQALPAAIIWPRVESEDVDLLLRAFNEHRLQAPPRSNLFMGSAYANVDRGRLRALANVFLEREWFASIVGLLTFGKSDRSGFDDIFENVIIQSEFISKPMDDIHEWSLFEITKRIIADSESFALQVLEQMVTLALSHKSDFGARRRVAELWPTLLVHDAVWARFKQYCASIDRHGRWRLLIATQHDFAGLSKDRLAIERRSIDDLIAFAREHVEDVPYLLAQNALMIDSRNDEGDVSMTPLMMALLENFGDRDDILRALDANMHSFLSVGPRAKYYATRMALVDDIPSFGRRKIDVWKEELRAALDAERERAQLHDEEIEKGIF